MISVTRYLALVLQIDRLIPGYVDAYYGPAHLKEAAAAAPPPSAAALLAETRSLIAAIPDADPARRAFLAATLRAVKTTLEIQDGAKRDYLEEVTLLYDISPAPVAETRFAAARQALDAALPGSGGLPARMEAYRAGFQVDPAAVPRLLEIARAETRRRTRRLIALPDDEAITMVMVSGQPWGAYNWYLGHGRSRVEFNTDMPTDARRLLDLLAHEGYPGHHTEHLLKEQRLYRDRGYAETAAQLLNAPAAVIAEGIATTALEIIFPADEAHAFNAEVLLPAGGLQGDAAQMAAVARAGAELRYVAGNGAIQYHQGALSEAQFIDYVVENGLATPERAAKSFAFCTHPLFRSYIFCYTAGYDLLADAAGADKLPLFRRLLSEQILPSRLASMAAGSAADAVGE